MLSTCHQVPVLARIAILCVYQRIARVYYFYKVLVHHDISISNATSLQKNYFEICAFFSWVSVQICGMCTY